MRIGRVSNGRSRQPGQRPIDGHHRNRGGARRRTRLRNALRRLALFTLDAASRGRCRDLRGRACSRHRLRHRRSRAPCFDAGGAIGQRHRSRSRSRNARRGGRDRTRDRLGAGQCRGAPFRGCALRLRGLTVRHDVLPGSCQGRARDGPRGRAGRLGRDRGLELHGPRPGLCRSRHAARRDGQHRRGRRRPPAVLAQQPRRGGRQSDGRRPKPDRDRDQNGAGELSERGDHGRGRAARLVAALRHPPHGRQDRRDSGGGGGPLVGPIADSGRAEFATSAHIITARKPH